MRTGKYQIADIVVAIQSVYDEVHTMCQNYLDHSNCAPEITICTSEEDIDEEARHSDEERSFEGLPPYSFDRAYLETLAVYRKLCTELPERGVLLMHGSVIAVDGQGYLFTASSGTGKSTHVRLWRKLFGTRAVMINDDKPLIRICPDGIVVYGTPWDGKHHLSTNTSVPLRAITILQRGQQNRILPISLQEAYPMLLQQTFRPSNPVGMMRTMKMIESIGQNVRLAQLWCNMDIEAAEVAYAGLTR